MSAGGAALLPPARRAQGTKKQTAPASGSPRRDRKVLLEWRGPEAGDRRPPGLRFASWHRPNICSPFKILDPAKEPLNEKGSQLNRAGTKLPAAHWA